MSQEHKDCRNYDQENGICLIKKRAIYNPCSRCTSGKFSDKTAPIPTEPPARTMRQPVAPAPVAPVAEEPIPQVNLTVVKPKSKVAEKVAPKEQAATGSEPGSNADKLSPQKGEKKHTPKKTGVRKTKKK